MASRPPVRAAPMNYLARAHRTAMVAGALTTTAGLLVVASWLLHVRALVQVTPEFAPTHFNTALGLVLAGVGLAGLRTAKKTAAVLGLLLALLGGIASIERTIGSDLGIDQALFHSWLPEQSSSPGRMGLSTAVCVLLVGLGFIACFLLRKRSSGIALLTGYGVLSISFVALIGDLSGIESAYSWCKAVRMSPQSAAAFLILSLGLVSTAPRPGAVRFRKLGLALAAGASVVIASALLSNALLKDWHVRRLAVAQAISNNVFELAAISLNGLDSALVRLSDRWDASCGLEGAPCERETESYFRDFPALTTFGWSDAAGSKVLLYRRSPQGVYREENTDFARGQERIVSGRPPRKRPTWFLWQPPGREPELRYVVQRSEGAPITWAGFTLTTGLTRMLGPLTKSLSVRIALNGHEIYASGPASGASSQQQWTTQSTTVLGMTLSFSIGSGSSAAHQTRIADLVLLAGILLGCLLATTVYLWRASRERSRMIQRLNADLREKNRKLAGATQRAEQANQAKTDFLAHMSHEIRTPLNGVIGLTELVADGPLTETKRPELSAALMSARTLLAIVNDVLDLAKIETGQLTVTEAPFDLHGTLRQIADVYGPQAAAKATDLRLASVEHAPRWLVGDEMRVRQIIANFTSNAVKFTAGGEIELGVSDDAGVRIWVRDTGIGIAPETLPRLFSKFTQADASTAQQYGGTGLGLAISKQLAELMGGRTGAISSAGRGSTFWVELPLARAAPAAKLGVRTGGTSWNLAGTRVLIAEDNPINQHLLVRLLEKHGLIADVASNGREALARYQEAAYAAVLMDCQMPVMDGYEAARTIRQQEHGTSRHTPIIAITANVMSRERDRCRAAGMDDYLTKPVQPEELIGCLARYCAVTDDALNHQISVGDRAARIVGAQALKGIS
jgi:signal transduction histidine kinase/FixJ family two-component response regulator